VLHQNRLRVLTTEIAEHCDLFIGILLHLLEFMDLSVIVHVVIWFTSRHSSNSLDSNGLRDNQSFLLAVEVHRRVTTLLLVELTHVSLDRFID
jgi:hypothetical protein